MTDSYAWYRSAIAGAAPPISDAQPNCGFFRRRASKDGPWLPAAIWIDKGKMICRVGGDAERDPEKEWTWLAKNPMPQHDVMEAFKTGKWPSELLLEPTVGHNRPPMELPELIAAEVEKATDWLKSHPEIKTDLEKDIASNMAQEIVKLRVQAEKAHKEEKAPILEQERLVDAKWQPAFKSAKDTTKLLKDAAGVYMAAEEERLLKIERERVAAERARIEAERAKAVALNQPPPPTPVTVVPRTIKVQAGGARGSKMGLKTVRIAVVVDYEKAWAAFRDHADMKALVQDLANRSARLGAEIPGVEVREERRAQ